MPGLLDIAQIFNLALNEQGKANVRGLLSDPMATLGRLGKEAGQQATQYSSDQLYNMGAMSSVMPEVREQGERAVLGGGLLGMTAYHGSPHLFDKFDMSKIGTGEGAQAYGHGLYFAEGRGTADFYRNMEHPALGGDPRDAVTAIRQNWHANTNPRRLNEDEVRYLMQDFPELRPLRDNQDIVKNISRVVNGHESGGTVSTEAIYAMRALDKQLPPKPKGTLYKVDIPDEAVAKMLDWDKPLSQQPAAVRKALGKLQAEYRANPTMEQPYIAPDATGKQIYEELKSASYQRYAGGGHDEQAALWLKGLGVPGIKYKDAGSRGTEGGTHNYVLFDDALAKILSRE